MPVPSNRLPTCSAVPHSGGGWKPSGGGGRWPEIVRKKSPMPPSGGPAADRDPPAGPQHAGDLARGLAVIGSEHHAEDRDHDVEALVVEGEGLRVPRDPLDIDSRLGGVGASALEQLRRQVEPGGLGAGLRRRDRGVPRPAGDVEHLVAVADRSRLHGLAPRRCDLLDDRSVVTQRPHRPGVPLLLAQLGHLVPPSLVDLSSSCRGQVLTRRSPRHRRGRWRRRAPAGGPGALPGSGARGRS